jgi:hypothetical protein
VTAAGATHSSGAVRSSDVAKGDAVRLLLVEDDATLGEGVRSPAASGRVHPHTSHDATTVSIITRPFVSTTALLEASHVELQRLVHHDRSLGWNSS